MCVYIYVCMNVCVYVCIYLYKCLCVYVCIYVRICVCMYVCTYVCIMYVYVCMCLFMYVLYKRQISQKTKGLQQTKSCFSRQASISHLSVNVHYFLRGLQTRTKHETIIPAVMCTDNPQLVMFYLIHCIRNLNFTFQETILFIPRIYISYISLLPYLKI